MNRKLYIALSIATANLLLILLFPPVDQYSIAASKLPIFAGFHFVLAMPSNGQINTSFLWLEIIIILVNTGIAWLLLHDRPGVTAKRKISVQNAVLIFTGANLFLVLLFPPFESVFAMTQAALPSFEGFYFIFYQKSSHVIVTTVLYIEAFLILLNGAILWLLFRDHSHTQLTPAQIRALASQIRAKDAN